MKAKRPKVDPAEFERPGKWLRCQSFMREMLHYMPGIAALLALRVVESILDFYRVSGGNGFIVGLILGWGLMWLGWELRYGRWSDDR